MWGVKMLGLYFLMQCVSGIEIVCLNDEEKDTWYMIDKKIKSAYYFFFKDPFTQKVSLFSKASLWFSPY